jgi:hypothetical protein
VRLATAVLSLAALALPLAACDGNSAFGQVLLFTKDIKLAAPTVDSASVASALDLTTDAATRFPEQSADAERWDVALRKEGGALYLRPLPATLRHQAAGVIGPDSRDFDALKTAPSSSHYADSLVVVQAGASYFLKSRQSLSQFGSACLYYAKAKATEVNVAAGTATFTVTLNETCNDRRLVE